MTLFSLCLFLLIFILLLTYSVDCLSEIENVEVNNVCIRPIVPMVDCIRNTALSDCKAFLRYGRDHNVFRSKGRILAIHFFNSVGNVMLVSQRALRIAMHFNLALIFNAVAFPAMRVMIEPSLFDFDERPTDASLYSPETHYVIRYEDGFMSIPKADMTADDFEDLTNCSSSAIGKCVTNGVKFDTLRDRLGYIDSKVKFPATSCNFLPYLLRMTPFAELRWMKMTKQMGLKEDEYSSFHIRTNHGDFGYNESLHVHVLQAANDERICESIISICNGSTLPIYISSNSPNVKDKCSKGMRNLSPPLSVKVFDFHLDTTTYHTRGEKLDDSSTSIGQASFLDYFMMTKAKIIYSTGSSFSMSAANFAAMRCRKVKSLAANRGLFACDKPDIASVVSVASHTSTSINDHWILSGLSTFPVTSKPGCAEQIWCDSSHLIQKVVYHNQNPNSCKGKKFLFFEPQNYGIGSMIHIAGSALSLAMCTNRILYFPKKLSRFTLWRAAGCNSSSLSCYFQPITNCEIDESSFDAWPILNHSSWQRSDIQAAPVVRVGAASHDLPSGPCAFCTAPTMFPFPANISSKVRDMFVGAEAPLMAQMVRYILRPQEWFVKAIGQFIRDHLLVPTIPRPFVSMHVRYGDKASEAPRQPLSLYMDILKSKHPNIRTVFLSTETEAVIHDLRKLYPSYVFIYMNYSRIEANNPETLQGNNRSQIEFIASFANLLISIQADAFVGSLTSNWCRLIHELERTRGDVGSEYLSVDGSQYSRCFRR